MGNFSWYLFLKMVTKAFPNKSSQRINNNHRIVCDRRIKVHATSADMLDVSKQKKGKKNDRENNIGVVNGKLNLHEVKAAAETAAGNARGR